jgi:DeoR family transcriptional regulator, catabolite repression regulator
MRFQNAGSPKLSKYGKMIGLFLQLNFLGGTVMAIGDRQLKILQAIHSGHTTGEAIVDALGSSMQMLSHYMNQMVDDGYIKAARLYDNQLRDFVVVRAYLTAEGEAALAQMTGTPIASPSPVAAASPTVASAPAAPTTPGTSAESLNDYSLVAESIQLIQQSIADLPEDWKSIAEVYLDDLKNEVNIAYRRRPVRIRAYFLAMLRLLLPVLPQMAQSQLFLAQTRVLSSALAIPVKLPDDPA